MDELIKEKHWLGSMFVLQTIKYQLIMKFLHYSLFLLCSLNGFAQDYAPFNSNSSKRFVDTVTQNDDYFFHTDSSFIEGDSIIFEQYFKTKMTENFGQVAGCSFWGGAVGIELDTTWLGEQIIYNTSSQNLLLKNDLGENLTFDFGLDLNDSSMFYSNSEQVWYLKYIGLEESVVLGQMDNIKQFEILSYDLFFNPIETELDETIIRLSENYGLVSFIDCYHFPVVESMQELTGQTSPNIGQYQLTMLEAYPWQTGDVIQYEGVHQLADVPYSRTTYETFTVIDRQESSDSIWIFFDSTLNDFFDSGGPPITQIRIGLSSPIVFHKSNFVLKRPHNYAPHREDFSGVFYEEYSPSCGSDRGIAFNDSFTSYCDECSCYGSTDGFDAETVSYKYSSKRGKVNILIQEYGPAEEVDNLSVNQVYSNIGGEECGDFFNSVDEVTNTNFKLFPNPASANVTVEGKNNNLLRIFDPLGKLIIEKKFDLRLQLDISHLSEGIYQIQTIEGTRMLLVQ